MDYFAQVEDKNKTPDKYALSECLEIISTYESICLVHLTSGRRKRHICFVDKYNGTYQGYSSSRNSRII